MNSSKIIGLKPPVKSTDPKKQGGGGPFGGIADAEDDPAVDNTIAGMKA
jgi:hypothetical protein